MRQLVAAALDLEPEDRGPFLDRACASDPDLRVEIDRVMARHSGKFDEPSPAETMAAPGADRDQNVEGLVIGPYIVQRVIGRGGMGVVYLADDTRLARRVALKSLSPELAAAVGGRERLRNEARLAAALSHPGIATVYALEEFNNQLYLACEYVSGEPLRALLTSGPLTFTDVVTIGSQLAKALAAAHTQGIVHRDIKPENVMKTPSGVIKVLDFGLARVEGDERAKLTQTGMIVGTPAYMSPEQVRNEGIDFRTDIFALGVVLYELASGVNPFIAPTVTGTLARIVETDPLPLSRLASGSIPALDRIVATCLQKKPAQRYKSTQELVADFELLEAELAQRRLSDSGARGSRSGLTMPDAQRTPLLWWEFHQVVMSSIYVLMMYPVWYAQRWLGDVWGTAFLFATLATAALAAGLRLHLLFLARKVPAELASQRKRTMPAVLFAEVAFAVTQFAAAAALAVRHREFAMLFVTMAIVTVLGFLVIEPASARDAFGPSATPAR